MQREIAEKFSTGRFKEINTYFDEAISWEVVGDMHLTGYKEVNQHCEGVAEYFSSVTTDFRINEVIESDSTVVIEGTGNFYRDNKNISTIEACDVYTFKNEKLVSVKSYCVKIKS